MMLFQYVICAVSGVPEVKSINQTNFVYGITQYVSIDMDISDNKIYGIRGLLTDYPITSYDSIGDGFNGTYATIRVKYDETSRQFTGYIYLFQYETSSTKQYLTIIVEDYQNMKGRAQFEVTVEKLFTCSLMSEFKNFYDDDDSVVFKCQGAPLKEIQFCFSETNKLYDDISYRLRTVEAGPNEFTVTIYPKNHQHAFNNKRTSLYLFDDSYGKAYWMIEKIRFKTPPNIRELTISDLVISADQEYRVRVDGNVFDEDAANYILIDDGFKNQSNLITFTEKFYESYYLSPEDLSETKEGTLKFRLQDSLGRVTMKTVYTVTFPKCPYLVPVPLSKPADYIYKEGETFTVKLQVKRDEGKGNVQYRFNDQRSQLVFYEKLTKLTKSASADIVEYEVSIDVPYDEFCNKTGNDKLYIRMGLSNEIEYDVKLKGEANEKDDKDDKQDDGGEDDQKSNNENKWVIPVAIIVPLIVIGVVVGIVVYFFVIKKKSSDVSGGNEDDGDKI